jgi:hypothetical protein
MLSSCPPQACAALVIGACKCWSSQLHRTAQVHKASGVPYREMLFFDNEVHTQLPKPDVFPLLLI